MVKNSAFPSTFAFFGKELSGTVSNSGTSPISQLLSRTSLLLLPFKNQAKADLKIE
jgi:hypothetical protein